MAAAALLKVQPAVVVLDLDGTTLTKMFSGGVWTTNLVISMVTGGASAIVYSVGSSAFETAKLAAVLWLATVVMDLKDASWDVNSLKDSKVQTGVAAVATVRSALVNARSCASEWSSRVSCAEKG